ncbi:MAG: DNA translocase FtsK 4TM domain-containing protein, partial [Dokdonella sp.]|nr:DNA translocase FtsK 4TM domain-containing protein [Dokdonella sp.]
MARESKPPQKTPLSGAVQRRLREVGFLLLLPLAIYLFACLWTYDKYDPSWAYAGQADRPIGNFGGAIGAWIAGLLLYFCGVLAYAFPALLLVIGAGVLREGRAEHTPLEPALRLIGGSAFFISGAALAHLHFGGPSDLPAQSGGVLGALIGGSLVNGFG